MAKVSASSLLEVVVALVVILAVFSIGMLVFTNITSNGSQGLKLRAAYLLKKVAATMIDAGECQGGQESVRNITIFISCRPYQESDHVIEIHLEAVSSDGRLLATHRELILRDEHE